MTPPPDAPTEASPMTARNAALLGIGFLLAALAVRLPGLGTIPLWIDEVNNWQRTLEFTLPPRSWVHSGTFLSQRLGLLLSDDAFGLRLSSALWGSAAVGLFAAWLAAAWGRTAALWGGALFCLSPFAVFYSQDANHYAPVLLAGVVAVAAPDFCLRERFRPGWLAVAFLLVAAALVATAVGLGVLRRWPGALWPLVGVGTLVVAGLAVRASLQPPMARFPGERIFGWNPLFWVDLASNLLAEPFQHRPEHRVAGVLFLAASVAGIVAAVRRRGGGFALPPDPLALGIVMLFAAHIVPFAVLASGHLFYPKFHTALAPALLFGLAIAFAEAPRWFPRPALGRAVVAAAAVVLLLFSGNFLARLQAFGFQPTTALLRWVATQAPPGSIIATRNGYSASALAFLWRRHAEELRGIPLMPTTYSETLGAPAIQEIEEAAARPGVTVFFVSLLESRERLAPDFSRWLDERTELVTTLESAAREDFAPMERRIHLRRVLPPSEPFALPRSGARPSALQDEGALRGTVLASGAPLLANVVPSGFLYRIALPQDAEGIALDYQFFPPAGPAAATDFPVWIVLRAPGHAWARRVAAGTTRTGSVGVPELPTDLPRPMDLQVLFLPEDGRFPPSGFLVSPTVLRPLRAGAGAPEFDVLSPLRPLSAETRILQGSWSDAGAAQPLPDLSPAPAPKTMVFVLGTAISDGGPDLGITTWLDGLPGGPIPIHRPLVWTPSAAPVGTAFTWPESGALSLRPDLRPQFLRRHRGPGGGWAVELDVWAAE